MLPSLLLLLTLARWFYTHVSSIRIQRLLLTRFLQATSIYFLWPSIINFIVPFIAISKKRIAISKEAFSKMGTVLKSRNIKFETKILIMKTYIWSVLLYGCECWTISKTMEKRLVALEMWFLRRIFRISWTEKISNKEVLNLAEYEPSLMRAIKKRQLDFFGHIKRRNGLEKLVLCGKINGTRGQGRQRQTYMDSMRRLTSDQDNTLTRVELIRRTEDREDWKSLVVNVCARPDT